MSVNFLDAGAPAPVTSDAGPSLEQVWGRLALTPTSTPTTVRPSAHPPSSRGGVR